MVTMTELTPTPDFTKPREPHRFRLGGKYYAAPAIISAVAMRRAVEVGAELRSAGNDSLKVTAAIGETFKVLVGGAGGDDIAARLVSEDDPIDIRGEAMPCLEWLIEIYGLRPTQPSSDSVNGSSTQTGDTSSTVGASAEASINAS